MAEALKAPVSVRFGKDEVGMLRTLRARARAHKRSLSDQLKWYAHLGMIAEANPDLPLSFVEGVLEAREEIRAGLGQPYQWGILDDEGKAATEEPDPHHGAAVRQVEAAPHARGTASR